MRKANVEKLENEGIGENLLQNFQSATNVKLTDKSKSADGRSWKSSLVLIKENRWENTQKSIETFLRINHDQFLQL